MPKNEKEILEDLARHGVPSLGDEDTGEAGIQRKGLGGYGADEESVDRRGDEKPLTDNDSGARDEEGLSRDEGYVPSPS